MPTLQQLNIDTETQEKLSTGGGGIKKRKLHPSSSAASNNNEIVKLSPHNTKKKHWSPPKPKSNSSSTTNTQQRYAPIKTPSALLSRNPTQLSNSLQTSLHNIKSIRNNAANEIINNDYIGHGKQCEEIINCVSRYCIANNDDINDQISNKHRPTALLAGAVTALDLCARELLLKSISSSSSRYNGTVAANNIGLSRGQDCISTGSKSIDQLLAPDSSYTSFHEGWTISYPYKIPSNNYEAVDQHQMAVNHTYPHPSTSIQTHSNNGGVPFGMVTEISGPPSSGKTQLALSIAAHAVLTNQMNVHYISGGNSTKALSRRLFSIFLELARSSVVAVQHQNQQQSGRIGEGMTYEMEEEAKSIALKALDHVHVASVPDAYSLLAMLARIDNEEKSYRSSSNDGQGKNDNDGGTGTLLVVDSISGCLGHHLSSEGGAALANQVALTLRQLARSHDGHIRDSCGADPSSGTKLSARRFAVVVTNGSVARYSLDKEAAGSSSSTKATTTISGGNQTQNKPAMGRYWHFSDVGIWLEEDKSTTQYPQQHQQQSINFYDDTSVVGLALSEKKVVCATLQNHYGKSCGSRAGSCGQMNDKPIAKFRSGGGIDDV